MFAACLVAVLCLSVLMAGCSGDTPVGSSSAVSSAASSSTVSASPSSTALSAENQEYIDLLTPALKELGETNEIENVVLDKPSDIEDFDGSVIGQMQIVHFTAGDRALQAVIDIDAESSEKGLSSISSEDDALHFYYHPGAAAANQLGTSLKIHVYDYNTDEEIDVTGETSAAQTAVKESVLDIVQKYSALSIDEGQTDDTALALNVSITSLPGKSNEDYATMYYSVILNFVGDYLESVSENADYFSPYKLITFGAFIDDEYSGFLMMYLTPSLFGTTRPIMFDSDIQTAFDKKYDEYMLDIDQDTLKAQREAESE